MERHLAAKGADRTRWCHREPINQVARQFARFERAQSIGSQESQVNSMAATAPRKANGGEQERGKLEQSVANLCPSKLLGNQLCNPSAARFPPFCIQIDNYQSSLCTNLPPSDTYIVLFERNFIQLTTTFNTCRLIVPSIQRAHGSSKVA